MKDISINLSDLRNVKGFGPKMEEKVLEYLDGQEKIKLFKSEYVPSDKYRMSEDINLWQGNCLELINHIPDKSIDMVLCDLPYGTTACSWDEIIPFEPLWSHYKRIINDNGAIVLFGSEPFSTKLRMSNLEWYKYDWVWKKNKPTGFVNANRRPIKDTERISIFYKTPCIYNPQGVKKYAKPKLKTRKKPKNETVNQGENDGSLVGEYYVEYYNYPREILEFNVESKTAHPTQKPVKLLEYLIKTYTNEGMLVLDNTMGSGSTGVACRNTNRKFIGIELDEKYFEIAERRMNSE